MRFIVIVMLLWSIAGIAARHQDLAPTFEVTFWHETPQALPSRPIQEMSVIIVDKES